MLLELTILVDFKYSKSSFAIRFHNGVAIYLDTSYCQWPEATSGLFTMASRHGCLALNINIMMGCARTSLSPVCFLHNEINL